MELTDRQPRPGAGPAWLLTIIVTVAALVLGAVGESVLAPRLGGAVADAEQRVVGAFDALTGQPVGSVPAGVAHGSAGAVKPVSVQTASSQRAAQPAASVALPPVNEPYVAVVQKAGPAVVTVVNQLPRQPTFFGEFARPEALGSGVIIDREGHIVTNNHVVAGGTRFEVIFSNGQKVPAELIGRDQRTDIAVLKVNAPVPAVARFADSSKLEVGQRVVAIGSALGDFRNTVTHGIISGLDRTLPDSNGVSLTGLIQTDAPINHGNSGGPLLNMDGQVIGLNTAVVRGSGLGGDVAEGLGFAIPSNTVQQIAQELIKNGFVARPYLGVVWEPVSPQIGSYYGLTVSSGALIRQVEPGSPAEKAGLKPGDVVTAVDGTRIDPQHDFAELLLAHKIGDQVRLTVQRGGRRLTLTVTLGEQPRTMQ